MGGFGERRHEAAAEHAVPGLQAEFAILERGGPVEQVGEGDLDAVALPAVAEYSAMLGKYQGLKRSGSATPSWGSAWYAASIMTDDVAASAEFEDDAAAGFERSAPWRRRQVRAAAPNAGRHWRRRRRTAGRR